MSPIKHISEIRDRFQECTTLPQIAMLCENIPQSMGTYTFTVHADIDGSLTINLINKEYNMLYASKKFN